MQNCGSSDFLVEMDAPCQHTPRGVTQSDAYEIISAMNLEEHYSRLLGIGEEWCVDRVILDPENTRVDIFLEYKVKCAPCPECGLLSSIHDRQNERVWRHLDTMQFVTLIHACPPRCKCREHGVKVIDLPWAEKGAHFTMLFEAFAIEVLRRVRSDKDAEKLLKLSWDQVQRIKERAVERGLARRDAEEIAFVGMDEKSFLAGREANAFACLMTDIDKGRVLDVARGRSEDGAKQLIDKALNPVQQCLVCGVAMDMSAPFVKAVRENLPFADIVFDKFHLMKHLGDAVNEVRKAEHEKLLKQHDRRLSKTRFLWLKGFEHLSPESQKHLKGLVAAELQTGKAWGLKEAFGEFWKRRDKDFARSFFKRWFDEVIASGLKPMIKVARMFKRHIKGILQWYDTFIDNAMTEGFNSKIQAIRVGARGFRNFENYRVAILFNCGKLDMHPIV